MQKNNKKSSKRDIIQLDYFMTSMSKNESTFNNLENLSLIDKLSLIENNKNLNHLKKSDYEFISEIGRGSYSKVLKAKNIHDNKFKAIKIIDREFMEKENKLYQVYIETEVLKIINHPLIVKCDGFFSSSNKFYIVMEYVQNSDFSEFLNTFSTKFFNILLLIINKNYKN